MTAVAHISEPANPLTGKDRLLAVARWLVAILLIHWLIACGRQLADALDQPWGPDDTFLAAYFGTTDRTQILARLTRALRHAADLEARLRARRPTEQGWPIEVHRATRAEIIDICQGLGFLRCAGTPVIARPKRSSFARPRVGGEWPIPFLAASLAGLRAATGPPAHLAA